MPHKKKPDVVTTFPNYDLHGAAAAGNIGLVLYALKNGQPINAVLGGLLPLHAAASGGSAEVVQLLIDRGADVNAPRLPSNTGPPIGVGGAGSWVGPGGIIEDGHGTGTSTAGEKLHKGRAGSAGGHIQPPVTPMARPGSSNSAQSLPIGRRGSTPLHFAAALGHADVVRLLLENGANPAAKDVDKSTPEMVARANNKRAIADFLRDWQATAGNTEAVRRSFESPISTTSTQNPAIKVLGTASDLRLNATNNSTASLPLAASTPPASHSTSSLGRYPNSGRRPSLPSIYESPPSTSYPRPSSGKKPRSPERPATATSMHPPTSSALAKLPFTIRRPKSAGNRDGRSGDDASSQHSHASTKQQNTSTTSNTASRLNRIFKRPNLRPATASGALSTSPSPTSPSPPVITRSRSPSASRITDKDNSAHRSGGLFHGHHLPHLHRRDHGHPHPHHHHLHVSRDAISGPIMDGSRPSTSIPDISRPDLLDVGQHNSSPAQPSPGTEKLSASPDEVDEDEAALYRTLNLTPAEIQYAKSRGALPDRLKSSARTAPPGQSSFGIGRKSSGSGLNRYPSHQGLSNKATTLPSPHIVPRHRAHLGPNGGMAMTAMEDQQYQGGGQEEYNRPRAETPLSFSSATMDRLSPAPHAARPVASYNSLRHEVDNRANEIRQQGDGAGSISSLGSHLSGSILSNDHLRSPEGTEDLTGDYISRPFKAPSVSTTHSPGGTSPSIASPGAIPFVDGRMISSRAQAQELVEAQRRAIQTEHRERIRAKRLASASSHRTGASHLAEALAVEPADLVDGAGSSPTNGESEDDNASLDEDDVAALREKLAALGETAQIERRFARGEQQAKRWNRESGLDDASAEGLDDLDRGVAASLGASILTRNEMLAGYLGQKELVDTERVKRPSTPKRDVFGRPVTPKKEGRPPTPKENRPATPKNPVTPTTSRIVDAPRENRILPPASKSQGARPTQHLTLQQTRAISKSDLGLSSHFNKDDIAGRERAWTTTDVRPRVGPANATSRPSTAGAKPSASTNGGLTIDIIQTMPTPTDASSSPLRKTPGTPGSDAQRESLQARRRYNSNPLRIDAKAAQEKALTAKESSDEAPQPSPNVTSPKHQPRQQSGGKASRKPSTPTKEQPAVLLHRITTTPPPAITLAPPTETPFGSFLSVSSNGGQGTPDRELPPAPVPALPSAVSLHNMHVARAREEAMKFMENPSLPQGSPPDSEMSAGNWNATAPSAAERRLGLGLGNQNGFGYESVRSFNEEKGGDKSYRLLGLDNRDSDTSTAGKSSRSKLGGLFSRLKR